MQAAVDYLARGWSVVPAHTVDPQGACSCGVVQCDRPGKHPRVRWAEYQKRRPTTQQVEAWWSQWPDSNIAIITGAASGLVVVDLDGPEASASLATLGLPETAVRATTGKGEHLYFAHPGGQVPNRVRLAPGVDVRADGGYVIAPPSRHQSGRAYAWSGAGSGAHEKPPSLPPAVAARLAGRATTVAPTGASKEPQAAPQADAWVVHYLQGVPESGGEGLPGRNEAAARLAGHYLRHLDARETYQLLSLWNMRNSPPMDDYELRRTIASIANREGPKKNQPRQDQLRELNVQTLEELMVLDEEVRWLVKDVWVKSNVGWVAGPPKLGKTWLVLDLAVSVATGLPFLGQFEVETRGPVLLVLEEDTAPQLKNRLGKILEARGLAGTDELERDHARDFQVVFQAAPKTDLHFAIHQGFTFSPESLALLEEHVKTLRPQLVIMDPFYRMTRGFDEYKASEAMAEVLGPLADLRYKYGCAVAIVHHTTKNTKATRGGERMYGSMAFHAWSESALHLTSAGGSRIVLEREFKSAAGGAKLLVDFGDMESGWNPTVERAAESEFEDGAEAEHLVILRALGAGEATSDDLALLLDLPKRTLQRRLKELADAGRVTSRRAGNSMKYKAQTEPPTLT